ncbi:MAG: type II toxin-antitoxin system RelE/ParE family toxin [Elusimicrobiota bacterium]|nr:type II toxin-antitoxin system RelE/ParE family toxin [Elusimicrobiota bacterium]
MKVRLLAVARQELDDAVAWYDEQATGLGREFLDEIDRSVRRAAVFPLSCPKIEPGMRRCLLARFPYGLIFGVDGETLVVVAVAHLHREPRYWVDRL